MPQTHLAPYAKQFGMVLRGLVVLVAPILPLLNPLGMPGLLVIVLLGFVYVGVLALLTRTAHYPPLWLTALLDVAFITLLVFFRDGLRSDVFLLYTIVLIYLTMAYAWRGAAAALALIFAAYLPMLALVHGVSGVPLESTSASASFCACFI